MLGNVDSYNPSCYVETAAGDMVEHDIGVECAILETKELVCGRLAVFISNRRRSPDIKYGCVSMLPLCGDVSGVSNSDMVRPYEHMYGLCRPPKHGCD